MSSSNTLDGFEPATTLGSTLLSLRNASLGRYVTRVIYSTTWDFATTTGSHLTMPAAWRNARLVTC